MVLFNVWVWFVVGVAIGCGRGLLVCCVCVCVCSSMCGHGHSWEWFIGVGVVRGCEFGLFGWCCADLLSDLQGSFTQRLSLLIFSSLTVQHSQIIECRRNLKHTYIHISTNN